MGATCTVQTYRDSCEFFSKSDKKKLAMVISKIQVSDPWPFWPSCCEPFSLSQVLSDINHKLIK